MKITRCKTNHIENPIGYDLSKLILSWSVEEAKSIHQKSARIRVCLDQSMKNEVFDSGYDANIDNRGYEPTISLKPYTRYFWQVTVVGEIDEADSEVHWFETGKMSDHWQANWITPVEINQNHSPDFKKNIAIKKNIHSARAYISGLGLYEFKINGSKVGDEYFTPYCNAYDAWIQYQTFDITELMQVGDNHLHVILGNGWAKGPFGTFGDMNTPYVDSFMLLCEIRITYRDGSTEIFGTDTTWKCQPSMIIENSIYDGERCDMTHISDQWFEVECIDPVGVGPVVERMSLPVVIKEEIQPVNLLETPAGEWVLDLGQNIAGWLRIRIHEPRGTTITISHGEILQDGNFYRDNLRGAKAQYIFVSDGEPHIVEPKFTYFGFRYAKLEGFTHKPSIDDFTGCCVYSDLETIGHMETSDPLVNRLFLNALWSQKDNFLDVPTDCPQRDERMGWTGDAQVFCGAASFNMDTYAFFNKFLRDLHEEQKFSDGMVAATVPTFSKIKHKTSSFIGGGASVWSDAAVIIPWEVYLHTGDRSILKRHYQSMKDWVDWIIRRDIASGDRKLWLTDFQFGDWLALDGPVEGGVLGGTDTGYIASAYYRHVTNLISKAADILNYHEDSHYYHDRSIAIKKAIQEEYFSKNGRSTIHTQTAYVVALHFDLVEEDHKARLVSELVSLLMKNDMHLATGFVGTPYLCRALSDHGKSKEAAQVFFQEDYPGWLYEVAMGATTIWERWNSIMPDGSISKNGMNSLNHYAYGSIVEWLYRNICGLKPLDFDPGFKTFIIKPEIIPHFSHASVQLNSPMGVIKSKWTLVDESEVTLEIQVPFNSTAIIILDNADSETVLIPSEATYLNNCELSQYEHITSTSVYFKLAAGDHTLKYRLIEAKRLCYDLDSPLWLLKQNQATMSILEKYFPHFACGTKEALGFEFPYSIAEICGMHDPFKKGMMMRGADLDAYEKEISTIEYPKRV